MTNWQMFKVVGGNRLMDSSGNYLSELRLDKSVEYANGYEKCINVYHIWVNSCGRNPELYIEIDIDKTKYKNSSYIFESSDGVARKVSQDVVNYNHALARTSSLNPEISAMIKTMELVGWIEAK